MIYAPEHR